MEKQQLNISFSELEVEEVKEHIYAMAYGERPGKHSYCDCNCNCGFGGGGSVTPHRPSMTTF